MVMMVRTNVPREERKQSKEDKLARKLFEKVKKNNPLIKHKNWFELCYPARRKYKRLAWEKLNG